METSRQRKPARLGRCSDRAARRCPARLGRRPDRRTGRWIPPSTLAKCFGTKNDAEGSRRESVAGIAWVYPWMDFAPHTTPLKVDCRNATDQWVAKRLS